MAGYWVKDFDRLIVASQNPAWLDCCLDGSQTPDGSANFISLPTAVFGLYCIVVSGNSFKKDSRVNLTNSPEPSSPETTVQTQQDRGI